MADEQHEAHRGPETLLQAIMNSSRELGRPRAPESTLIDQVLEVMRGLGIQEVRFSLSGGGDEGDCQLEEIVMADGSEMNELPAIPVTFTSDGSAIALDSYLESHASEAPDGNWCDNEGGSGTVVYRPFADDVDEERVEIDMSYGDDDCEDCDGDEDEDLDDVELGDDLGDDEDDEEEDQDKAEEAR